MALQIRRGTNAERQLIIPLQGELIFTTDTKQLYVGDGTTQGGIAVDLAGGAGAAAISELSDVTLTSLSTGQVLKWNGSAWVNSTDNTGTTISSINDINDVVITTPSSGQVLKFNGTNWVNGTDNNTSGASALTGLSDVSITTPTNGQVLKFNGTSWVNDTDLNDGTGAVSLDDITDVVITTPTTGQVLKFNGTSWINDADIDTGLLSVALEDLTNVTISTPGYGDILQYTGTGWESTNTFTGFLDASLSNNLTLNGFAISGTGNIIIDGDSSSTSVTTGSVTSTNIVTNVIGAKPLNNNRVTITTGDVASTAPTTLNIETTTGVRADLELTRTDLITDLSVPSTTYGRISFVKTDANGTGSSSIIVGGSDFLLLANRQDTTGSVYPDAGCFSIKNYGNFGFGTKTPSVNAKVDINGIMKLRLQTTAPLVGEAGMVAVADGNTVGWDPKGTNLGIPYPVFYNGTAWVPFF